MHTYYEKEFKNVAAGDLDLQSEDEKKEAEEVAEKNSDLFDEMQKAIGDGVSKVTVSSRLTDEPVCLVAEGPVSLEMEKVFATNPGNEEVKSQRVLEVNPNHKIFETLKAAHEAGNSEKVALYSKVLFDQALLIAGLQIEDPVEYAQNVCKLMEA